MTFTLLSLVILSLTALYIYFEARKGYKRGFSRSLIHVSVLLVCAFFACAVSVWVVSLLDKPLKLLLDATKLLSNSTLADFADIVLILMRMVASILLYVPVFFLLRFLVGIIIKIVYHKLGKDPHANSYLSESAEGYYKYNKAYGAAVGAICGFLIAVVTFTPLVGVLRSATNVVDVVSEIAGDDSIKNNKELRELAVYSNDFSAVLVDNCGGRLLFDLTSHVEYGGESTYLNREIAAIKNINVEELKNVFSSIDAANEESVEAMTNLIKKANESLIAKTIILNVVKKASTAWMEDEAYMGVKKPNFGANRAIDLFLNEILYVCSTSTLETIGPDLTTLVNLSKIFTERKSIFDNGNYEAMISEFIEGDTERLIRDELEKNPHMQRVIYAIDDLIMTVVSQELTNGIKYSVGDYEDLYSKFAAALSETFALTGSVRVTALSEQLSGYFEEYGMYMPEGLNDRVASLLISGIANDNGEVTKEDVEEFFNQYLASGELQTN